MVNKRVVDLADHRAKNRSMMGKSPDPFHPRFLGKDLSLAM